MNNIDKFILDNNLIHFCNVQTIITLSNVSKQCIQLVHNSKNIKDLYKTTNYNICKQIYKYCNNM
jgi:hypothetical protein